MKNKIIFVLILTMLALSLGGCFLNNGSIDRVAPLTQTLTFLDGASTTTAYWQVFGNATIIVDYGDGSDPEQWIVDTQQQVSHNYDSAGEYTARFIEDGRSISTLVTVTTDEPIVRFPFFLNNVWDSRQRISFNIPVRNVGCESSTGQPSYVSGITPGDGVTQFRMTAYDIDGYKVPLFNSNGDNVWGEWINLVEDISHLQMIYVWLDWYHSYPMGPTTMSMSLIEAMACPDTGCGDPIDPDDGWILPDPTVDDKYVDFKIEGRNQWMSAPYPSADKRVYYDTGECI